MESGGIEIRDVLRKLSIKIKYIEVFAHMNNGVL